MTDPGTPESKPSLLVGLPPELQRMISENLNRYDLNRLCLTCKTIKAVVLPKLYKKVFIKVPQRWSRLPSLEGLLGSTGDGLKYTTELVIDTQQDPLRDSQQGPEDSRPNEEVLAESRLQFYLPQSSASNTLNTLIRLLIVKLAQDQLFRFRYVIPPSSSRGKSIPRQWPAAYQPSSWDHGCELDVSTLTLVLERQSGSLLDLFCSRYSSSCDDTMAPLVQEISCLSVESMDPDRSCQWPARMIADNAKSLDHLNLGFITRIAHDFALNRRPQQYQVSTSFADTVREVLSECNQEPPLPLSLKSLYLCGLDLRSVIQKGLGLDIDFGNITELRLESCPRLSQALSLLVGPRDSSKPALGALQDLFVRLEDPDPSFSIIFENLLTSVRRLVHLHVLIDNTPVVQNLEPILSAHGKTLRTLVWDERRGPRVQLDVSTSVLSTKLGNLKLISRKCKKLTALGLPLDWKAISSSDKFHETIEICFRRMPNLEMLVIRNLPELRGGVSEMPMDYFVKGLATMFLDVVNKNRTSTSFKTIALGAPLYRDINIGTHHVVHNPVSDFLRYRVYNIDYEYPSPSGLSTVLSEVAKGAAVSGDEAFKYRYFLDDYWLG